MRLATWNVNSLRARADQLLTWLVERDIDIALLQETKCTDEAFPFNALADLGYDAAHHGKNHWNGVAIVSRVGLKAVVRGFNNAVDEPFDEPRLIAATCAGIRCWSVYVPNGRAIDDPHFAFKLEWLGRMATELATHDVAHGQRFVGGDFNVGRTNLDFYDAKRWKNKKHATVQERAAVDAIVNLGLTDLARAQSDTDPMFTWWNYVGTQFAKDKGLRIDLALASVETAQRVQRVWVDRDTRDPLLVAPAKPSDHAPLIVDLAR